MDAKQETKMEENQLFTDGSTIEPFSSNREVFSRERFPHWEYQRSQPMPTKIIFVTKEPSFFDLIPLIFGLVIYGLVIQTACIIVKKINKRLYDRIVFVVLYIAPAILFLSAGVYFFLFTWVAFSIIMTSLYIKINRKPLQKEMPRKIFNIFKGLFILTNLGICIFQTLTIFSFLFSQLSLVEYFTTLLTFVYFGLLSREFVYFFSETMATNTGFYSKEGVPKRNNNDSLCMICTKVFDNTELVHTLICNHSFHENCIRGWCMIAKKSRCPYCKKGVDLESIPKDLWYKSEIWFYPLINTLRNFIVFTVAMSAIIYYKIATNKVY